MRGIAVRGAGRAWALLACPVALLAGCGASDNDPGPGGVTVGEARALDEAAEMLDEQRLPGTATATPAPESEAATQNAER